ncbi:MAG: ABC transporter substrate-binding protein, partial [Holophagales bacterium]|nr:ABC transporter substrate-binding protein [Holophagales bacterium]
SGLRILSGRELAIRLERPTSNFLALLTDPSTAIVAEGTRRFDGTWKDGSVGTGPFCLVGLEPGRHLELAANPDYWRAGYPRCEHLSFALGVPPARIARGLEEGTYHLAGNLSPAELDRLVADPLFAAGLVEHPGLNSSFLLLNRLQGPLADPRLRASVHRLLRDAARRRLPLLGRAGMGARGLLPPGLLMPDVRKSPRGIAEADSPREVAADLRGVALEISVHPGFRDQFSSFWQALVDDARHAGLEIRELSADTEQMLAAASRRAVDGVATRWNADTPDPSSFADLLHCDDGLLGRLICHEKVDRLVEKGREENDLSRRQGLYRGLERELASQALLVPLFHEQICWLGRPEVKGLRLRYGWPEVAFEELALA